MVCLVSLETCVDVVIKKSKQCNLNEKYSLTKLHELRKLIVLND